MDGRSVTKCFPLNLIDQKDHSEGEKLTFISQFVYEVIDFSSQYGSDSSISYTAYNLSGKPSNYPDYGDFPQAFVMRTYGNWWREAPSCSTEFMRQNLHDIPSHDYVDIAFEEYVYPAQVQIYETYNPGAVVRIWALDGTFAKGRWSLLWEGAPQVVERQPRIFSPRIKRVNFKTRILRIEFNHSLLEYYSGIDAVQLGGSIDISEPVLSSKFLAVDDITKKYEQSSPMGYVNGCITQQVIELNLHHIPFESNDLQKVLNDFQNKTSLSVKEDCDHRTTLECLPNETLLKILGYLDLLSLGRVAQVNRHLHGLAMDSFLYSRLTLRPYWNILSDAALSSLSTRCRNLQRLDLSWCGNYGLITSQHFIEFVGDCCNKLTHIRLNCCKFVGNTVIKTLAEYCKQLRELSLRNCVAVTEVGFLHLTGLSHLETLDLYRTVITTSSLVAILRANPQLRHLNIGACTKIDNMDEVARTLGTFNKNLISLDLWKTSNLSQVGVRALSQCSLLEELDLGWCLGLSVPVESLASLAKGCPNLRKLFLTALRGICDKDLEPFVHLCPKLEQIDLLGVHSITPDGCIRLLLNLPKLRYLDLSFCYQISDAKVSVWRHLFPGVAIKRSSQADLNRDY